jgi:hypothetical protein
MLGLNSPPYSGLTSMHNVLGDYFRCPEHPVEFSVLNPLSEDRGFFSFGPNVCCYGRACGSVSSDVAKAYCHDLYAEVQFKGSGIRLPFDPRETIDNLLYERYMPTLSPAGGRVYKKGIKNAVREAYYLLRPLLPVPVRKHLQRAHLNDWQSIPFPKWPVDTTVDTLLEQLLTLRIKTGGGKAVPFIWFWPDGATAAAIVTHDVETEKGVILSSCVMDTDESYGIPSSFQIVPEHRYNVTQTYLKTIRDRGFEVNVHDLNHDGRLFNNWSDFKHRVTEINRYGREFGAVGFRSAVLYRNQDWYNFLDFEYDMSVPNVAHLDPQRGGCCTVMPYFIGKVIELPVTMTQDYSLFNILNDCSLNLWKQQSELIRRRHGLLSVIVHPDYLDSEHTLAVYRELLAFLADLNKTQHVWIPLPKEVNKWWRERSEMTLSFRQERWQIEGAGSERARVAFACLNGDRLTYTIQSNVQPSDATG